MFKYYPDTIFRKNRTLNGHKGSVFVSHLATKVLYQVLNPNEDNVMLKGWGHNSSTKGKT